MASTALLGRMVRAARLDAAVYEEVEADTRATVQALLVILLSGLAAGIGSESVRSFAIDSIVALVGWFLWAFVTYLDAHAAVDVMRKIGTTGYCMGGPLVLRTAAARADRIGAAATFHGGGLVTEDADSPHLLIPQTKAHYLIAIAANDDERDPNSKSVLRETFDRAHLSAEVEVYAGTQHGWCPPDSVVYNRDQAEKAWGRLLVLLNGV